MNEQTTAVPATLDQIGDSLLGTLAGLWSDFVAHVPFLLAALLALFATWGVAALVRRSSRRLLGTSHLRRSLRDLITRLASIGIWVAGILVAAMIVFPGLTPARAIGALGLVSVAVGFAFKDIFENFFAGILLLWRFPFENGDFIECEGIMGKVEDVTIRMTQIRRPSGELVVVPNGFLFKNPVHVLTNEPKRRVSITAGVAYGEDVEEAVGVIQGAVERCGTVDGDRPVQVFPQAFGASSVDIEVAWWTDPTPVAVRRSRGEVVTSIKCALDDAGIEIPFPYRTLTFKEPLGVSMRPADANAVDADAADRRSRGDAA